MINKIKAEVKRLMNNRDSRLIDGSYFDFEHLLFFIESLEKEQDVNLDFQRFSKEMDAVFALPAAQTKNTEDEPLNWEYAIAKHFYELGCRKKDNAPKIKGWVARDENGELWFHHLEPMRDGGKWNFGGGGFKMGKDIYPALSWHDEPIEVELVIRAL